MKRLKFQIAPNLKQVVRQHLLPESQNTDQAIVEEILVYQSRPERQEELKKLALGVEVPFAPIVNTATIRCMLYPSQAARGCDVRQVCSLFVILKAMIGAKADYFDKNPDLADFVELEPTELDTFKNEVERLFKLARSNDMVQPAGEDITGLRIVPTLDKHLSWIANKQIELYGKDAVPSSLYRQWFAANSSGFYMFLRGEDIIGHITVLPFKEDAFAPYRIGTIKETDLGGDAIWGEDERYKITLLYVESYMLDDRFAGLATTKIRRRFLDLALNVTDLDNIEGIYAMNATDRGTNTILKFGFREHPDSSPDRIDKHKMFFASVADINEAVQEAKVRLYPKNQRTALRWLSEVSSNIKTSRLNSSQRDDLSRLVKKLEAEIESEDPFEANMLRSLKQLEASARQHTIELPDGRESVLRFIEDVSEL